jgi:hypothetical protein
MAWTVSLTPKMLTFLFEVADGVGGLAQRLDPVDDR